MSWTIVQFLRTLLIALFLHQMTVLVGWAGCRNIALQNEELICIERLVLKDYVVVPFNIE